MPTLSVDDIKRVNTEFQGIGAEVQQLSEYLKGIELPLPAAETSQHWRHSHVCGSAVERSIRAWKKSCRISPKTSTVIPSAGTVRVGTKPSY
jgi:hypothetical protein